MMDRRREPGEEMCDSCALHCSRYFEVSETLRINVFKSEKCFVPLSWPSVVYCSSAKM